MNLKIPAISNYFLKEQGGGEGVLFKMSATDTLGWIVKALCVCHSWKLTIRSINRFYRLPHKSAHPARLSSMKMRSRWLMGREEGPGGGERGIQSKSAVPGGWGWDSWRRGAHRCREERGIPSWLCHTAPPGPRVSALSSPDVRLFPHLQDEIINNSLGYSYF